MKRWISISFVLFLVACTPETKYLLSLPTDPGRISTKGKNNFSPKVDIIFVIDNSGSMSSHQNNMAANIDLFANSILKNQILDFHIGVITTDGDGDRAGSGGWFFGPSVPKPYVEKGTPNFMARLRQMMMPGTSGSSVEKVFEPLKMALSPPVSTAYNAGFLRDRASLAVVVVTDADDQSQGLEPADIRSFLINLKQGDPRKIITYGAFIPSNYPIDCQRDDPNPPQRLEKFFALTGGKYYGLCDPDFGTKLGALGDDLVTKVAKYIYLDRIPNAKTIRVTYGTQLVPEGYGKGWVFDPAQNAVVLGDDIEWLPQPDGTAVEVDYKPLISED